MCFSAAGSFALSGVLAGLGAASLARNEQPSQRMFAAVPLLFAAQQAAEGTVWLTFDAGTPAVVHRLAIAVFLGVALVVWPTWLSASLRRAEPIAARRRALTWLLGAGFLVAAGAAVLLARRPPGAHVAGRCIAYDYGGGHHHANIPVVIAYAIPTVVPLFVSSLKRTGLLGVVLVGSLIVTIMLERDALTSVWCFFAAILSAIVVSIVAPHARESHVLRAAKPPR